MAWTAARVREELPDVQVKIGRKVVQGRVSGRLNQFATVSVTNGSTSKRFPSFGSHAPIFMDWSVAWDTIAHSLNTGKALIV